MAFDDKTKNQGHDNDRLSLLPDTILIDILSRLPLKTAASTEVLSPYWRGLWTQITSIDIDILELNATSDFILRKLTSPSIHNFNVACRSSHDHIPVDSWLRRLCERSLRHFRHSVSFVFEAPIPSFLFQTRSLLSIELHSPAGWSFRDNIDPINVPNLVTLSLSVAPSNHYDSLEKLIESCPSLEKLSLKIARPVRDYDRYLKSIKLSNNNLRWFYIGFLTENNRLSINAPMLRYLAICAEKPPTLCFDKVPIGLHEAEIYFYHRFGNQSNHVHAQSDYIIDLISKFYETISNVTILHIYIHALTPVTLFPNVTRLTLTGNSNCDSFAILSKLVHFPKLNILILKFGGWFYRDHGRNSLEGAGVSALRQVKRIDIDTDWDSGYNSITSGKEFFSRLIVHLLKSATVLEHFNFSRQASSEVREGNPIFEESEYSFCRLLYDSPRASKECEVSFTGRCLLMSAKTVPNVLKANGEVFPLNT